MRLRRVILKIDGDDLAESVREAMREMRQGDSEDVFVTLVLVAAKKRASFDAEFEPESRG